MLAITIPSRKHNSKIVIFLSFLAFHADFLTKQPEFLKPNRSNCITDPSIVFESQLYLGLILIRLRHATTYFFLE